MKISNFKERFNLRDFGVLVGFVGLVVIIALIRPEFISQRNILNLLRQSSIIGVIASGMTFVIISGNFDISVGAVAALAGSIAMKLISIGYNVFLSLVITLLVCVLVGFINGFVVSVIKIPSLIATMATVSIARGSMLLLTGGYPITQNVPVLDTLGNGYFIGVPNPVWIFIIVVLISYIILTKTKFGRHVYSVGGNEEASRLNGINVESNKIKVFIINAILAGLAGIILIGRMGTASPSAGEGYDMDAIASVVIGGTSVAGGAGSIFKTVIGVLLMSVINNSFNLLGVDMYFQYIIKGFIILVAVGIDSYNKKN